MIREIVHMAILAMATLVSCVFATGTHDIQTQSTMDLDSCFNQEDSVRCALYEVTQNRYLDSLQLAWLMDALGESVANHLEVRSEGFLSQEDDWSLLYAAVNNLACRVPANDTVLWALLDWPRVLDEYAEIGEYMSLETHKWVLSNVRSSVKYFAVASDVKRDRLVSDLVLLPEFGKVGEFTSRIDSLGGSLRAPAVELRDSVLAGIRRLPKR